MSVRRLLLVTLAVVCMLMYDGCEAGRRSRRSVDVASTIDLSLRNEIHNQFPSIAKTNGINIFEEASLSRCVQLLETPGLTELVYRTMQRNGALDEYEEMEFDEMQSTIQIIGRVICEEEDNSMRKAEALYNKLSEHAQNEIEDDILKAGSKRSAWDVSRTSASYYWCIATMQESSEDIINQLHSKYPQISDLPMIVKLIVRQTCDAYFNDKREL